MGEHLQNHKKLGVAETSGSQTFQLQVLLEHFTEHKPGDCSREGRSHQSSLGGTSGQLVLSRIPPELGQPCPPAQGSDVPQEQ